MAISIFFFTTICLNLWEEKELQNFVYDRELNESNSNRRSGNQNTDIFKKNNSNMKEKDDRNKYNLPNNEEVKVKNSYQSKI